MSGRSERRPSGRRGRIAANVKRPRSPGAACPGAGSAKQLTRIGKKSVRSILRNGIIGTLR